MKTMDKTIAWAAFDRRRKAKQRVQLRLKDHAGVIYTPPPKRHNKTHVTKWR